MKLLIDADGCPVVNLTLKTAKAYGIEVILFCDTAHLIERTDCEVVRVPKGRDAADFVLANRAQKEDLIITSDYGLAAMGTAKGAYGMHPAGFMYTAEKLDELLLRRHIGREVRRKGGHTKGPKKRTNEDNEQFEKCLIQFIETAWQLKKE